MVEGRYDVAVVGLGAMGAATLCQLARRGARVVGIDRFAPPHDMGSSHGDTRITRLAVGEGDEYVPLVARSHEIWRELETETGSDLFEQCGVLVVTSSAMPTSHHGIADFTGATIDIAQRHGIPHAVLDATAIRGRFPQFSPVIDTATGYFEPAGGYVRPERCIAAQLQVAARHGADVVTGTPVRGIDSTASGVTVDLGERKVHAGRVVVCAGMWTAGLLGPPFDRVLTVYRQVLHWFPVAQPSIFPADSPTFVLSHGPNETDLCYGFPPLPGEHAVKIATEQYTAATTTGAVDRAVAQDESSTMYRDHVAGRIAGTEPVAAKSAVCAYTVTPDFGFLIDRHPDHDRVTVVSACSGHGFKHSAAIGEAVAQHHVSGRSELDLGAFTLDRLR